MFRRIEIIRSHTPCGLFYKVGAGSILGNIMRKLNLLVSNILEGIVQRKKVQFFFTELGWEKIGRHILREAIRKFGKNNVRVITCKENYVDVVYRDRFQVAVRYRKRK